MTKWIVMATLCVMLLLSCVKADTNTSSTTTTTIPQSTSTAYAANSTEVCDPLKPTECIPPNETHFWKSGDTYITIPLIREQLEETDSCCMQEYLSDKYGVTNYKKGSFKYQVCGAKVFDCWNSRNDKYFVSNIASVDKWGSFYFGLLWNKKLSALVHSIGWCESGYNPATVSADGGYGVFQITPSAIGDKSIKKSMLLNQEYNTQYGVHHFSVFYKSAKEKYEDKNKGNEDFLLYLSLRGYNGGFKWLDRIFDSEYENPESYLFSGDYIEASKISGRFVCFEKVNTVYPLKIYITSESLMKKAF